MNGIREDDHLDSELFLEATSAIMQELLSST